MTMQFNTMTYNCIIISYHECNLGQLCVGMSVVHACLYTLHRLLFALIESYLGNLLPTKTIALSEVLGTISYPLPAK